MLNRNEFMASRARCAERFVKCIFELFAQHSTNPRRRWTALLHTVADVRYHEHFD